MERRVQSSRTKPESRLLGGRQLTVRTTHAYSFRTILFLPVEFVVQPMFVIDVLSSCVSESWPQTPRTDSRAGVVSTEEEIPQQSAQAQNQTRSA